MIDEFRVLVAIDHGDGKIGEIKVELKG